MTRSGQTEPDNLSDSRERCRTKPPASRHSWIGAQRSPPASPFQDSSRLRRLFSIHRYCRRSRASHADPCTLGSSPLSYHLRLTSEPLVLSLDSLLSHSVPGDSSPPT